VKIPRPKWIDRGPAGETRYTDEPGAGALRRLWINFFSILPIEAKRSAAPACRSKRKREAISLLSIIRAALQFGELGGSHRHDA